VDSFDSTELQRLRSPTQSFRPRLVAYKPAKVWQGVLQGSHSKGSVSLAVVTTAGDLADVLPDQTLLVGSGTNEVRLRVRSAGSGIINVNENSVDFNAYLNQPLAVLLLWEPFPVAPRIVNDGTNVQHYRDYDVPYSGQNAADLEPVTLLGPSMYALELDCQASGTFVDLTVDASESFCLGGSITNYAWTIMTGDNEDWQGQIVGSSSGTFCTFRFYDVGDYYISCQTTSATGKTHTARRPIAVRCNTPGLANSPFINFEVTSLQGSRDQGYWSADIDIFEDCNQEDLPRNTYICLYGEAVYATPSAEGMTRSTTQVPWHYDTHNRFVGFIQSEEWTDEYRVKGAVVALHAVGLAGVLNKLVNYPAWVRYDSNPTDWTMMADMTVDRMLVHYLKWFTTVLSIADLHITNDTRLSQYLEVPTGSIQAGLRNLLSGTIAADIVSDRQGALWCEIDGQLLADSDRASVVTDVMTLSVYDYANELTIPVVRDQPSCSWLSLDGLYFDGSSNAPMISWAPGYSFSHRGGQPDNRNGYVLKPTQAELNEFTGRMYSSRNLPYGEVHLETVGVMPYDICPQASVKYSGLQSGTFREETLEQVDLLIRSVSDKFRNQSGGLTSELNLEVLLRDWDASVLPGTPVAVLAVTGIFPPTATGIDPDEFSLQWPAWDFSWPAFSIAIPARANPATVLANQSVPFTQAPACYALTAGGIYRTRQQTAGSPLWEQVVALADLPYDAGKPPQRVDDMILDPWNPKRAAYIAGVHASGVQDTMYLWYIENLDGAPGTQTITKLFSVVDISIAVGAIHASINVEGAVFVSYGTFRGFFDFPTWVARRTSYTGSFTFTEIVTTPDNTTSRSGIGHHATGPSTGKVYVANRPTALYRSTNFGGSYALLASVAEIQDIHVPYNDNPNDELMYFGCNVQLQAALRRRNADGTLTSISPFISSLGRYAAIDDYLQIHTFTHDRQYLSVSPEGRFLFRSINGGDTWEQVFDNGSDANYRIGGWPFNREIMFIWGNAFISWTDKYFSTTNIVADSYDLTGNLNTLTGSARVLRFVPVWVP
jgi:hypothetical protein